MLSEKVELYPTYIGSIEKGEGSIAFENIVALSKALSCSPKDLMLG
jgi:DNA-binding Xre family transcriptional regulator